MRFLIDANLPRSTVEVLQRLGHEVGFARYIGLAAAADEQIAAHALKSNAAILTRDLDFADTGGIHRINTTELSFCVCRTPPLRGKSIV